MTALRIEKLTKYFGGVEVLKDISFNVEQGDRLAIIGPNGAGKTTLFNMINGQLPITSGRIYFFDREITKLPAHQRVHMGISRSFQIISLLLNLSVWENTLLTYHGFKPSRFHIFRNYNIYKDIFDKAGKVLKIAGLWEKRNKRVGLLSYGEQRRLEIILSMVSEPRLLLLDEPSNGLTSEEAADVIEMINLLGKEVTVLIVAHDMDLVFGVAEKINVLYYGELLASGKPEEIRSDQRVREIYMGSEEHIDNA